MTDGIRFGSRAPSTSFQRIPSVKLDNQPKTDKANATATPQALTVSLASSIDNNKAAGSVLGKISEAAAGRREIAKANRDSARASLEEVETLAQEIAKRVSSGSSEATEAHRMPEKDRANELLRE